MTAAGSTVLVAAAASGVVTLWPATTQQAAAAGAGPDLAGSQVAGARTGQLEVLSAYEIQRQRNLLDARMAVEAQRARQAAEWRRAQRAARRAHERAELLAARRAAEQQAAQQQRAAQQPPPPAVSSGSPQQIAMSMLPSYGWASSQFSCLDPLWNEESGWNVYATNSASGAYGIPQALPPSKMASAGPDWQTDAATQITWGLGYIQAVYGSPCNAWAHEQADGWY
jgi:hypothetical protein